MSKLLKIIGALSIAIIPVFLTIYLSKSVPDVRYTLFERIGVNFPNVDEKLSGSIQQIEVRNVGNAEAKRVVIKINGEIKNFRIEKVSELDDVKTSQQENNFEINYPELPPESGFKFIFISSNKGIEYRDITVSHSAGKAKEALTTKNTIDTISYISLGLVIIYFVLIIYSIRKTLRDTKKTTIETLGIRNKVKDLLEEKKPFYITDKEWLQIYNESVETQIQNDVTYSINERLSYLILSSDKPKDFDESTWQSFVNKSVKDISETFISKVKTMRYTSRVEELLKIHKPKHFPENIWSDVINNLSEDHISLSKQSISKYESSENILKMLKTDKPKGIAEKKWEEHINALVGIYLNALEYEWNDFRNPSDYINEFKKERPAEVSEAAWLTTRERLIRKYNNFIWEELNITHNPLQIIKDNNLEVLKESQKSKLEVKAYKQQLKQTFEPFFWSTERASKFLSEEKPVWVKNEDYDDLRKKAENIINSETERKRYNELKGLLSKIINTPNITLIRTESISEDDWNAINDLSEQLIEIYSKSEKTNTAEIEIIREKSKLTEDWKSLTALKEKVTWQLEIIDKILSEPNILEKIEDYNNLFAQGNFQNLKFIAELLSKK